MGAQRERQQATSRRLSRPIEDAAVAAITWGPIACAIALSPGFAAWALLDPDDATAHLVENALAPGALLRVLTRLGGSALLIGAIYVAAGWAGAVRAGRLDHALMWRLTRGLAFLLAVPLGLAFLVPGFESDHPFLLATLGALAAAAFGTSAAELARVWPSRWRLRGRWVAPAALGLVLVLGGLWAREIVDLQVVQHRALRTGTYDLGIYLNVMWQSLQGNFLACTFLRGGTHLSAHFDPILVALSPTLLIHRGAETLFVVQAVWLASGAAPVFLLGRRHGGVAFGVVLAAAYLLHPALQGVSLFDFHSMALSIPPLLWAVVFLEERRWWAYAVAVAVLLSCREDMAVEAAMLGLYAIAVHRQTAAGVATIVVGVVYLAAVKVWAMPDPDLLMATSRDAYSARSVFRHLDPRREGMPGILATVVSNPTYLAAHLVKEARLLYLIQLVVPLALLPLAAGRRWVLGAYGVLLVLLASRDPVYTVGFHYAATLLPALFAVAPSIARAIADRLETERGIAPRRTFSFLAATMLVAGALYSSAFGAFGDNERFVAGFFPLERRLSAEDRARYQWLMAQTSAIPADDSVAASAPILPHLATRLGIYALPTVGPSRWVISGLRGRRNRLDPTVARLRSSREWELVAEEHEIAVFRRRVLGDPAR